MERKYQWMIIIYVHYKVLTGTECTYVKSREESAWVFARQHCTEFGGHLATLDDLVEFRTSVRTQQTTLLSGEELWVGASLQKGLWKWMGENSPEFKAGGRFYARKGCLQHELGEKGQVIQNITPEKCLNLCQWQELIGLQEDKCLCDNELNVTSTRPGICHIRCKPDISNMCGGYYAISLYKPGKRRISWAESEPKAENDCVVLKKAERGTAVQYVSASCEMRTRFLCSFHDSDKCGVHDSCLRWSTSQATWISAVDECLSLNGTLSDVSNSGSEDVIRSLSKLTPGTFWIALRRESSWQWINGQKVYDSLFTAGTNNVPERTCAAVRRVGGNIGLVARRCDEKKHYLCQYDYMRKRESMAALESITSNSTSSSSTTITSWVAMVTDWDTLGSTDYTTSSAPEKKGILFTCLYMVLGFVSGMVCVLIIGLIVYLVCRCRQPNDDKHNRLSEQSSSRHDIHSVNYSSKDDSIHISPPLSDVTYDTVYDIGESPFRRTQRLIRMGSANSWRHAQSRRPTNDSTERSGFTWRGDIGGDVEIINTELRHQMIGNSHSLDPEDLEYGASTTGSARAIIEYRDSRYPDDHDFDQVEVLYDLPERSDSLDCDRSRRNYGRNPRIPQDPRFLEIRTSRGSESNEENIYATIKKTFEKIRDELAEQVENQADDNKRASQH